MNGAIVVTIINSGVEAVANQVRNIVENTVMNASIGTEDTILERFNIISCQESCLPSSYAMASSGTRSKSHEDSEAIANPAATVYLSMLIFFIFIKFN